MIKIDNKVYFSYSINKYVSIEPFLSINWSQTNGEKSKHGFSLFTANHSIRFSYTLVSVFAHGLQSNYYGITFTVRNAYLPNRKEIGIKNGIWSRYIAAEPVRRLPCLCVLYTVWQTFVHRSLYWRFYLCTTINFRHMNKIGWNFCKNEFEYVFNPYGVQSHSLTLTLMLAHTVHTFTVAWYTHSNFDGYVHIRRTPNIPHPRLHTY